jgi:hypothetical protein
MSGLSGIRHIIQFHLAVLRCFGKPADCEPLDTHKRKPEDAYSDAVCYQLAGIGIHNKN